MRLNRAFSAALVAASMYALPVVAQDAHDHDHDHSGETAEEHAAHADEAHHDDHHGHVSASAIFADGKFRASLVSFGLLVALGVYFLRQKIRAGLTARKREIEEAVAEANRVRAEAEAKKAELEQRLARLDEELATVRAELKKAAEAERDRIVQDAETKAALLRKDTKFQIEQRIKQLREDLTRETVLAAVRAAEKVLADKTTAADQQRLADAYLAELAKVAQPEVRS
jgi:F-type H+-transporting ATPase subunit b